MSGIASGTTIASSASGADRAARASGAAQHLEPHEQDDEAAGGAEGRDRDAEGGEDRPPAERRSARMTNTAAAARTAAAGAPRLELLGEAQEERHGAERVSRSPGPR
jgi:hypothetical protein